MFPNYEIRYAYPGKVGQSRLFETLELPHPKTFRWREAGDLMKRRRLPHKFPMIVKDNMGHEAEGVFLARDQTSLGSALDILALRKSAENKGFITQDLVPCGGNVLRSVILGERILTYWKRPVRPGQFVTTISKGARIDHDWKPDLQEKGRAQARVLAERTGINLAAVDFLFSFLEEDPAPLILEINYFFGRRGLGGMDAYYRLLFDAIRQWVRELGLDPGRVALV